MRLKKLALIGTVIVAIAVTGWWLGGRNEIIAVSLHTVERGTVEQTVANTRTGSILACRRTHLAPQISGRVDRLRVTKGDRVRAGQVLVELWSADISAQQEAQQNQLLAARTKAEEACILARHAAQEAERLHPLHDKGLVSDDQYRQADATARAQQAGCRAAQDNIKVAQSQLAVATADRRRTVLKAPFAGVIAELNAEEGEIVSPGAVVVDLIDPSCLYVSAPIDEIDAPSIKPGMPAFVMIDAFPQQKFAGRVRRVAPYVQDIEKQARTVEVEVEITDAKSLRKLSPGYSADVEVILDARRDVLWVPANAVMAGAKVLVYQASDGRLVSRKVSTGIGNWQRTEILSGLKAGDRVVTSTDRPGVVTGAKVKPEP